MNELTITYATADAPEVRYDVPPAGLDGQDAETALSIVVVGDATYTLTDADHSKFIHFTDGCTVTVPTGLMSGFSCVLVQEGSSQVVLSPSGTTIRHSEDHTSTRAQYASMTLWRRSDTVYFLGGETA